MGSTDIRGRRRPGLFLTSLGPVRTLLAEALPQIDPGGSFTKVDARRLRDELTRVPDATPDHPSEFFGEWSALPPHVQQVLRQLAEAQIARVMAFHPRGPAWPALARWRYSRGDYKWGVRLWQRPGLMVESLVTARQRAAWRSAPRPKLGDLIAHLGLAPGWLLGDFAEGVRVDARCRGFFSDARRQVVHAYLLGVDLIPSSEGIFFIEANTGAGLRSDRFSCFDTDPLPPGVMGFAKRNGAQKVVWFAAALTPLDAGVYASLKSAADASGLQFEVLEDPRLPPRTDLAPQLAIPGRALFPPTQIDQALVVVTRGSGVGPSHVVTEKQAAARALAASLKASGDSRVKVLPLSADPGEVEKPADPGLPNLVYKYPRMNKGEGVHFLKAKDADHARELAREIDRGSREREGRFQRFVPPDPVEGRRLRDVRAMVLISPEGAEYLGAIQRPSTTPVPDRIPEGIVEDRRPFILTQYFGNPNERIDPSLEPRIREAAMAVAEGLAEALNRTFVTRADRTASP